MDIKVKQFFKRKSYKEREIAADATECTPMVIKCKIFFRSKSKKEPKAAAATTVECTPEEAAATISPQEELDLPEDYNGETNPIQEEKLGFDEDYNRETDPTQEEKLGFDEDYNQATDPTQEEDLGLLHNGIPSCLPQPSKNYRAPTFILDPRLGLRFPEKRETLSLDLGFDQTPVLKKISGYYAEPQHSLLHCPDTLTPLDPLYKLRDAFSKIAPAVVSVSSFLGLERKIDCSGLVIDWCSGEATILTSAKLLSNSMISDNEFHLIVRTGDGKLFLAREDHVDFYYNLLFLKVKSTIELDVVDLRSQAAEADIVEGMNVIALGRCFYTRSLSDNTGRLYMECPNFGCGELLRSTCYVSEICEGGPVISDTGLVVGINFVGNYVYANPLPTPVVLTCLQMWRSSRIVLRPWLGLSVVDENHETWEKSNISPQESFVVVKKVFKGSLADQNNVRSRDLVATLNGTLIRSAKQYLKLMSEKSLEVSACGSVQRSFKVVVNASDRLLHDISIEAEFLSVDDKRFYDCWTQVAADEWTREKLGSQKNPRYCWPPNLEIC